MNRKEFLSSLSLSDFRIFLERKKKERERGKKLPQKEERLREKRVCLEGMKSEGSLRKKFGSKNLLTGGVIS